MLLQTWAEYDTIQIFIPFCLIFLSFSSSSYACVFLLENDFFPYAFLNMYVLRTAPVIAAMPLLPASCPTWVCRWFDVDALILMWIFDADQKVIWSYLRLAFPVSFSEQDNGTYGILESCPCLMTASCGLSLEKPNCHLKSIVEDVEGRYHKVWERFSSTGW